MSDNAVSRRLRRLFSMSGDEFVTRSRQELGKRMDGVLARAGHQFSEAPRTAVSHSKVSSLLKNFPPFPPLCGSAFPTSATRSLLAPSAFVPTILTCSDIAISTTEKQSIGTWTACTGDVLRGGPVCTSVPLPASPPNSLLCSHRARRPTNANPEWFEAFGPGIRLREYAYAATRRSTGSSSRVAITLWKLRGWSSDTEFLYWSYDRRRERGLLIFCAGTTVTFNGCCRVECAEPVASGEVIWENGRGQVLGPNRGRIAVHDPGFSSLIEEPELSASARKQASE